MLRKLSVVLAIASLMGVCAASATAHSRQSVMARAFAAHIHGLGAQAAVRTRSGPAQGAAFVDGSPGFQNAVNPRTASLYVPIQCTDPSTTESCNKTASHVVDVINTNDCNPKAVSNCSVVARAEVGKEPDSVVSDEHTDTLYVANTFGNGSVSVVNGARCNARVKSGCGKPIATFEVGGFPAAEVLDPATGTLYVAVLSGKVDVINAGGCSRTTRTGCKDKVQSIPDPRGPDGIAVDFATDTVYAANAGLSGDGHTVSVINGATCNAKHSSGCDQSAPTIDVGNNPAWDVVDQPTNTVYVANFGDGTVSVINGATCNATAQMDCETPVPAVTTGAGALYLGVNDRLHTLFTNNQDDGTMSEIDTASCRGGNTTGCPARARNAQAMFNPPQGYNATSFALVGDTGHAYLVNAGGENYVAAADLSHCAAIDTSGCRVEAPTADDAEAQFSFDPATDTLYASSLVAPEIDVLNGATCQPSDPAGCAPVAEIPVGDPAAFVGAIDQATHTLYAGDSGSVYVIDTATCNAGDTAGCSSPAARITVGRFIERPVLNPATRTLYVLYGENGSEVSVINAASCNAQDTSGCGQQPATATVNTFSNALDVSAKYDTVYVPSSGQGFSHDSVSIINGATCNGTVHTGCGPSNVHFKVGLGPFGVAVDDVTNTVYVANNANGDLPGSVSVINTAKCNATTRAGCAEAHTVTVGRSPLEVVLDSDADRIYVSDFSSAAVSVINGATCNATRSTGCAEPAQLQPVGSQPFGLGVNTTTHAVYVGDIFGGGALSIFAGSP